MKEILEKALARAKADGFEGHIEEVNGADTLRLLPENLGPNENVTVVMEIYKIPMKDVEECGYYQFYTMLEKDLDKARYADILVELNELNLTAIIGSYGILTEEGILYHKATMRLPVMDDDALADNLIGSAYDCLAVIDYDIAALVDIISE